MTSPTRTERRHAERKYHEVHRGLSEQFAFAAQEGPGPALIRRAAELTVQNDRTPSAELGAQLEKLTCELHHMNTDCRARKRINDRPRAAQSGAN
jgi:hypothetical protein